VRLLLDTNRYDDLNRGDPAVVERVSSATEVWIPLIVLGELRAGFLKGSRRTLNETLLSRFLGKPQVDVLLPTKETSEYYAQFFVALRKLGKPIPTNDMWIAAQALQHNLTLDTRDKHFKHVPQLKIVK